MTESKIRKKIIALCQQMNDTGLNQGTSGNISARYKDHMLITPSGIPYEDLVPADIAEMKIESDNTELTWKGPSKPSSEWHFHRSILQSKTELNAIVHTHSMYATILSIARQDIPACHYMIAAFGGNTVKCAKYATFGTPQLSACVLSAMKNRSACLLANHGMIAGGRDLDNAMWAAVELETLSKQYYHAKLAGEMFILPAREMAIVVDRFKNYGQVKKEYSSKSKSKPTKKAQSRDLASATQSVAKKKSGGRSKKQK